MLILTQHTSIYGKALPQATEHFVEPERIRFFATEENGTTVITHDGSMLQGVQESPMTIARMRAAWEFRHNNEGGDLPIAIRADEDGDCGLVACKFVALRRTLAKVEETRAMADDLSDKAEEAQALAGEAEAALEKFQKT